MNVIQLNLLAIFMVFLTACVSTSNSVAVRDIEAVESVESQQIPIKPKSIKQAPVYQERAPRNLPIVERLFTQADAALQARQWEQAIVFAEKGLRIERKEPRFYWVLAFAYEQLSNKKQSQSFARQGLRYTDKNSSLARRLVSYLP